MSAPLDSILHILNERFGRRGLRYGLAKFHVKGEGSVLVEGTRAYLGDAEADVTLTADAATFHQVLVGELSPIDAVMAGRMDVQGNMGLAMSMGSVFDAQGAEQSSGQSK